MAASIVGVRNVNPTLDGVSAEQEQDANSALTELDKGTKVPKKIWIIELINENMHIAFGLFQRSKHFYLVQNSIT